MSLTRGRLNTAHLCVMTRSVFIECPVDMPLHCAAAQHLRTGGFAICSAVPAEHDFEAVMVDLTLANNQHTGL